MAYMKCKIHGENIASLVSEGVLDFVLGNSKDLELNKIHYKDEPGKDYYFYVDEDFLNSLQESFGSNILETIKSEETAFEISLELKPVCPACLNDRISKHTT
ncbi:hypothetical protein [Microbulbifer sp. TB1203]|uniref:hypothetical protein n=2 Tax=unclassified Microbulbifer TaxID=2619833 RepID=UPI0027E5B882|nr:hypothetical protein [Microbulbifer sp. TB1203]